LDPISENIRSGNEATLLGWLREEVHPHGRKMNAENLVRNISGSSLSSDPFISYLKEKLDMVSNAS